MSGDTLRWFGTTVIAGAFGLVAMFGIIYLAAQHVPVPDTLTNIAILSGGGFFGVFGAMVGAKASQNGAQAAAGQTITEGPH